MPATPRIADHELLDRLTRVFQDHGYEGASLTRISGATGLEKASLYHRFPRGKDQMAEAVIAHVGAHFVNDVLAPLRGSGPIQKRIRVAGRRLEDFYEDGQRSCLLDTLSLSGGSSRLRELVSATYDAWRGAFASIAREAGLGSAQARTRAEEAIIGIHGALVLARATGERKPFTRMIGRLPKILTAQSPTPDDSPTS